MQERTKSQLRTLLRRQRQELPADRIAADSARVRALLLSDDAIRTARSVLLYLPTQGEIDTWPLLDHYWNIGSEVLLPRCRDNEPGHMDMYAVINREQLAPGSFGLIEPVPGMARLVPRPCPDVVCVPALGFDRQGYRIGFGGGYYDRFLPGINAQLVGLAHDFQILDRIPADPWDTPVHRIVTPSTVFTIQEPCA